LAFVFESGFVSLPAQAGTDPGTRAAWLPDWDRGAEPRVRRTVFAVCGGISGWRAADLSAPLVLWAFMGGLSFCERVASLEARGRFAEACRPRVQGQRRRWHHRGAGRRENRADASGSTAPTCRAANWRVRKRCSAHGDGGT